VLTSCVQPDFKEIDGGVVVYPKEGTPAAVKLSTLDEDIIKVEISAEKAFDTTQSLIAVGNEKRVEFQLQDSEDHLELHTAKLLVEVNKNNSAVSFFDSNGNKVLAENQPSDKLFKSVVVDGEQGYELHQKFIFTDNEAIYGLGQHQVDEMNYKGKNEELFQYNTKVSIPFIVSTGNYGILWDNYSLTRYGDHRPYANLDQFKLYDKNNEKGDSSIIPFTWSENKRSLIIGERQGQFAGMLGERKIRVIFIMQKEAAAIDKMPLTFNEVSYTGEEIEISLPKS